MANIGIYAGPGKVYRAADTTVVQSITAAIPASTWQVDGENGNISLSLDEAVSDIATALFGKQQEQLEDQTSTLTFRPFDNWAQLPALFPPWFGVTVSGTGGATGLVQIGGRPFGVGASHVPMEVWTPDGRIYQLVRSALVRPPDLHLGVSKGLFGEVKFMGIGDETKALGASGFLFTANAITESGGADPSPTSMTMGDFERGAWTGVWGTVAGFGGAAGVLGGTGGTPMQSEDEWTITSDIRMSPLKVQGRTYHYKIDSCYFMAKFKPYGPAHSDLIAAIGAHTQGQRLGSADLTLSGPNSKTIVLKNAEIKGAGFRFGGTTLGTNDVGFVTGMTFAGGVPQPLMTLSA